MRYFLLLLFLFQFFSLDAQDYLRKAKREVGFTKLSIEEKLFFLESEIKKAKESKDYESLEQLNLELNQLRSYHFYNSEKMSENGFFVDALVGISFLKSTLKETNTTNNIIKENSRSFALRFGNKWYLSHKKNHNFGLQATYFTVRTYFSSFRSLSAISYSLANIGFIYYYQSKKNLGLELNFNAGYNALINQYNLNEMYSGFNINPELKIRFRKLAFGIDYASISNFIRNGQNINVNINILSFSFGAKF